MYMSMCNLGLHECLTKICAYVCDGVCVYPLEESITIDDVSGSSLDEVFLASPPPPMPTLLLYILILEENTSTSGLAQISVLSLVYSCI